MNQFLDLTEPVEVEVEENLLQVAVIVQLLDFLCQVAVYTLLN